MKNTESWLFKTLVIMLALSMLFTFSKAVLAADSYPTKPVRLVVPTDPGGGSDAVARMIAPELSERLGKPVIVENRGGGGSVIGTESVAKADPDGYTLLAINSTFTIQPALEKLPYDPLKSFTIIANLGSGPNCLVVHPSVPAKSLKELIALAKKKPGDLLWASAGVGSSLHMSAELFKMLTDTDFTIIQFKGSGPAMTDLLGGHTHVSINSIMATLPSIKSGGFRVLTQKGPKRSVLLPEVPTYEEAGLHGYDLRAFNGIIAPAGTPGPIVDKLNKTLKEILASDKVKKQFQGIGVEVDYADSTEFRTILVEAIDRWKSVVKRAGIKLK